MTDWTPVQSPGSWDYDAVDSEKLLALCEAGSEVFWFERLDGTPSYLRYAEGTLVEAVLPDLESDSGLNIMANAVLVRGIPRSLKRPTSDSQGLSGWVRGTISGRVDLDVLYEFDRELAKPCSSLTYRAEDVTFLNYDFDTEEERSLFLRGIGFKYPPCGVVRDVRDLRFLLTEYPFEPNSELIFRPNAGGESGSVSFTSN